MHGDGTPVKHARLPSEHDAVELLDVHPAANYTFQDTELSTNILSLSQTLPPCALATDGMEQRHGSHVKDANVLTEHAAAEPLALIVHGLRLNPLVLVPRHMQPG